MRQDDLIFCPSASRTKSLCLERGRERIRSESIRLAAEARESFARKDGANDISTRNENLPFIIVEGEIAFAHESGKTILLKVTANGASPCLGRCPEENSTSNLAFAFRPLRLWKRSARFSRSSRRRRKRKGKGRSFARNYRRCLKRGGVIPRLLLPFIIKFDSITFTFAPSARDPFN